jgi:nucleotide-binding universal stress UspA family protein
MAKRILVPLDRTAHSETVLPVVADAARGAGAVVRLLTVVPEPDNLVDQQGHVIAYCDQEAQRMEAEVFDYLRPLAERLFGTPVECVVRFGDPAQMIALEADAFGADLVVLTTSAQSRLRQLLLGGTATRVCARTEAAVLVLRPAA